MEGRENSGATSSGAYNKLINQDVSVDEQPLYTDQDYTEKQQGMVNATKFCFCTCALL